MNKSQILFMKWKTFEIFRLIYFAFVFSPKIWSHFWVSPKWCFCFFEWGSLYLEIQTPIDLDPDTIRHVVRHHQFHRIADVSLKKPFFCSTFPLPLVLHNIWIWCHDITLLFTLRQKNPYIFQRSKLYHFNILVANSLNFFGLRVPFTN